MQASYTAAAKAHATALQEVLMNYDQISKNVNQQVCGHSRMSFI